MVPGYTALSHGGPVATHLAPSYTGALPARPPGAAQADTWAKNTGSGGHQEPAGNPVTCWSETYCYGVVRMCHTWCDNGEDTRKPCGGCVGVGGVSLDLW